MKNKTKLHFQNKIAVITGGASGIGLALAQELCHSGAKVIITDINNEALTRVSENILLKDQIKIFKLDITDQKAVSDTIEKINSEFGKIDFFFNNAGIGLAGEVRDLKIEDWRKVMEVNLFGTINCLDAVYQLMIKQGSGHIINTSSGAALAPRPGMVPYAAGKQAVLGISISLRAEAEELGVKVSAVCPGYISTNIMNSTTYKNIDAQRLKNNIPIKPVSAEECARQILSGVAKNKAIIIISKILYLEWLLFRFFPNTVIKISKLRAKKFAVNRMRK